MNRGPKPSMGRASMLGANSGQSPALVARVNEKKIELNNLMELRDLSAQLAKQMQMLEEKLSTLSNGTEAIAAVLSNWHNVLRAINMASAKLPLSQELTEADPASVSEDASASLPQTLVRMPVGQYATGATNT